MQPSGDNRLPTADPTEPGQGLAVTAEALYLANLLVLPLIAFLPLLVLFLQCDRHTPPLARAHLEQTFGASLWAGILLVFVNGGILLLGGYSGPWTWLIVILYFTLCHSSLVLLGMFGLARAMAGQCFRFPLVGRPLPEGCRSAIG